MVLDVKTASQMINSFTSTVHFSVNSIDPATTSPRPRLSALVSACNRV
jgi:hypothetical protein